MVFPTETVLSTRPFRDGEDPGLREMCCLGDVRSIFGVVEPLLAVLTAVCGAVDVLDVEWLTGIDVGVS